jgi:hypothetical protein
MKSVLLTLLSVITIIFVMNVSDSYSNSDSSGVILSDFGTEFWFAIPHVVQANGEKLRKGYNSPIQLWIASKVSTKVVIESVDGLIIPKKEYLIEPSQALKVDLNDLLMLVDNDDETATNKGIHITSDDPVSVDVFMTYEFSGEAFHVIPVEWLGKEYFTLNLYQDTMKTASSFITTPGQIVIIATQNNTNLTYKPKAITQNGIKAGNTGSVILQKGQTFLIQSKYIPNMSQQSVTDLSGTYISSNYPVAIISGHTKGAYPPFDASAVGGSLNTEHIRNALVEMLIPHEYYGSEYISVPIRYTTRGTFSRVGYKGDLIRFVATENNTLIYQMRPDGTPMQISTTLKQGEIFDIPNMEQAAYYYSSKPVLAGQYGKCYDSDPGTMEQLNGNGMLLNLIPLSSWCGYASFRVASNLDSYIYLIFDSKDTPNLKFDDIPFNVKFSGFQQVPGTSFNSIIKPVDEGTHTIEGDNGAKFAGYCYGYHDEGYKPFAYGYPIGINFYNSCNDSVIVTDSIINDKINGKVNAINLEKDSCASIHKITLLDSMNYSFKLNKFTPGCKTCDFVLQLINSYDTAYAVISIITNSGKEIIKKYYHNALANYPLAPKLIAPANGSEKLGIPIKFEWSKSEFDTIYILQAAFDSSFVNIKCNENDLQDTIFSKGGFSIDSTYYWRVRASNYFGDSPWSDVWKFSTYSLNLEPISPPDGSINHSLTNLSLKWTKPLYTSSFTLLLSDDNEFTNKVISRNDLTDTVLPVNLTKNNQTYYWKVQAKSADGQGPWTDVWSFVIETIGDVSEPTLRQSQGDELIIFPNPTTQKASIKFDLEQPSNVSLKLTDMLGNQITLIENQFMDSGSHSYDWDASGVTAGVYHYVLQTGGNVRTGKVVVVK